MAINLHTHMFNALYLPVGAIFANFCRHYGKGKVPESIGFGVGRLLELITIVKTGIGGTPPAKAEAFLLGRGEDAISRVAGDASPEMADDPTVRAGLDSLATASERAAMAPSTPEGLNVRRRLLERLLLAMEPVVPESIFGTHETSRAAGTATAIRGWARWVWLMTEPEMHIAAQLRAANPKVGVFVHHLMDMEHWYAKGHSHYPPWPVQFTRVDRIAEQAEGRLLTFAAFDPKRGANGVEHLKLAVKRGAAGVKFYAPNGYLPIGNADKKLDEAATALYNWCATEGVPILAHCTPSGFEAEIGKSGSNAAPALWRPVLESKTHPKWRELRLCFGHAGGETGWLSPAARECKGAAFSKEVLDLCAAFPNVYCELAYFNDVRKPDVAKALRARLVTAFANPKLATKIGYGTDWHMPQMVIQSSSEYFDVFETMFSEDPLTRNRDDFFWKNASRFLNLRDYVAKLPPSSPAAMHLKRYVV